MFEAWGDAHGYGSLEQLRGVARLARHIDQAGFERSEYASVLQAWSSDYPASGA